MHKFTAAELERFLRAVDAHLAGRERIVVLGGGALALAYDSDYRTQDIDLWTAPSVALLRACGEARQETGLDVPLGRAGVSDIPYNAEDRLVPVVRGLRHLEVLVFDEYDVALSKVIRGLEKDYDAIERMHRKHPLDYDVLLRRYVEEMDHVTGSLRVLDQHFINLVDTLYGEAAADRARLALPARDLPKHVRRYRD